MANNYSLFSEQIEGLSPDESKWVDKVLRLDSCDEDEIVELKRELSVEGKEDVDLDSWPQFDWALEGEAKDSLWLYTEEGANEDHLIFFVQALICKFRPDYIFSVTGSCTCSKPRIGEFGGWWLVISKDEVKGGNTWDAVQDATKSMSNLSGAKSC